MCWKNTEITHVRVTFIPLDSQIRKKKYQETTFKILSYEMSPCDCKSDIQW